MGLENPENHTDKISVMPAAEIFEIVKGYTTDSKTRKLLCHQIFKVYYYSKGDYWSALSILDLCK